MVLTNLSMDENSAPNSSEAVCTIFTVCFVSGRGRSGLISSLSGHSSSGCISHGGPSHHSFMSSRSFGIVPLDTRSAGLLSVGTCFQCVAGTLLRMSSTWFTTKILRVAVLVLSQRTTVEESVQAYIWSRGMFSCFLVKSNS